MSQVSDSHGGAEAEGAGSGRGDPAGRRRGPFWIDEPSWFWALAGLALLLGLVLFLVAVGFDPP